MHGRIFRITFQAWIILSLTAVLAADVALAANPAATPLPDTANWWMWPLALFAFSILLGSAAVVAGVEGALLYVPLVSAVFPFHLDFVRTSGLLVGLAAATAATPALLRRNRANLRLALPFGLAASLGALPGALLAFALPTQTLQLILGITVVTVSLVLLAGLQNATLPAATDQDSAGAALRLSGTTFDETTGGVLQWQTRRTTIGLLFSLPIGFLAGLLGLGSAWANLWVFHSVLCVPLKIAVGSSRTVLSVANSTASWVCLNHGGVLALLVIPSILGMLLGSFAGLRMLALVRFKLIRKTALILLLLAGVRALFQGLGL